MIEEASTGIIEAGIVAIVLAAGIIFMYRYFKDTVKTQKEDFQKEIKRLNEVIKEKDEQIQSLMVKDIEISTQLNATLEQLTKAIKHEN